MIEAYVTNLGKYNEGELCGEWLKLPTDKETVKDLFARIGIDGVLYEEFFITDYETDLAGLQNLGEYESIDELNYLAALLDEMPGYERETFEAAAVCGDSSGSVKELINLTQNLDCYDFYRGIKDNDDLGRFLIYELGYLDVPEHLQDYIDYESYGRDYSINEGGEFVDGGYILRGYGSAIEHYSGRDDIPDEHRVFAFPDPPDKMPIKDQLRMYAAMTQTQTAADKPVPARAER